MPNVETLHNVQCKVKDSFELNLLHALQAAIIKGIFPEYQSIRNEQQNNK